MNSVENWKATLVVFTVLVAAIVYGGWLPGSVLFATLLLLGGGFAISANQMHPGWYVALIVVVLVLCPALIAVFLVAGVSGVGYLAVKASNRGG